ncbi:MAG: dolichyl-phosphate beta-glucosyltransferase [bacterium]
MHEIPRRRPPDNDELPMDKPFLSVIIPAYREAAVLRGSIESTRRFLGGKGFAYEVIVVDDGSPDNTAAIAEEVAKDVETVSVFRLPKNRGKGAAVRLGMQKAKGRYALFMDADFSTPIEEVDALLQQAERGVDVVMGSRYLPESTIVKKQPWIRRFMSRAGNLLFHLLLGMKFADTRCGFKLYSEKARAILFSRQTLERWGFDTELLAIARVHHLRVIEVPVHWTDHAGRPKFLQDSLRSLREIQHVRKHLRRGDYQ